MYLFKVECCVKAFVLDLLIFSDIRMHPSLVSVNNSTPKDVKN